MKNLKKQKPTIDMLSVGPEASDEYDAIDADLNPILKESEIKEFDYEELPF